MEKNVVISIVTPFYQQEEVFWETCRAVQDQTFTAWEWIIVDDGSTNSGSVGLLQRLADLNYPGIKVISHASNLGLPAARNTGVKAAIGDYVFFLDSDDLIEPDYLEKAWLTLRHNAAFDFVNSWSTGFGARNYEWKTGLERRKDFLSQNWVAFAGLFRKEMLLEVSFNESRKGGLEDWEFWLAAAARGFWGYTLPEKLFHYRIHATSGKWNNWDNGKNQDRIKREFRKKYNGILSRHFPDPQKSVFAGEWPVLSPSIQSIPKDKPLLLIVLPWLSPGGVEQFTLSWMKALSEKFNYILVTTNASLRNDNAAFKHVCQSIFHLAHLSDISLYPSLISYVINSRQPDMIVLSHSEPFYHLLPYIRRNFPTIPVVDINHIEDMQWQDGGYPKIASLFSSFIDRHIVISDWLKQFMVKQQVEEGKLETIYINTDPDRIRPLTAEEKKQKRVLYDLSADRPLIVFSGRLTHQKRVLLLPDIAEILVKRGLDARMIVCGDGPDREMLEESIYRKGLGDKFLLAGEMEHTQAIDHIQAADIFLLPSAWEGIATVLYEAMAAGLPVITTDVGGQRELVTPDCGILLPSGEPDGELAQKAADAVQRLLEDADLRKRMGQAGRERIAAYFNNKTTYAALAVTFEELMERGGMAAWREEAADDYQGFAQQWNILHAGAARNSWRDHRQVRRLRKLYKIITFKRPLSYLWGKR